MPQFSFDLASRSDQRECREAIRRGSKTFYAASRLLPAEVRQRAFALYAFCRLSDDAVDLSDGAPDAILRLTDRLDRAARGRPRPFAADRALADAMRRSAIPLAIPEALLEGLAWDAEGRSYETLDDLYDYAARVAGTVGVMMTLIMGVRSAEALARACDLGVAMQLTNIARDVGEDARLGRVYLPRQWLREAGVDANAFLADPRPDPLIRGLVARLLDQARTLYRQGQGGVALLPANCRPAIVAAGLIYAEIGARVERNGFDFGDRAGAGFGPAQARTPGAGGRPLGAAPRRAAAPGPGLRAVLDRRGRKRPSRAQAPLPPVRRMAGVGDRRPAPVRTAGPRRAAGGLKPDGPEFLRRRRDGRLLRRRLGVRLLAAPLGVAGQEAADRARAGAEKPRSDR